MESPNTKEETRVSLLMSINEEILSEISRLQSLGQGGAVNPQQALQLRNANQSDKMASEDYIQLLRRVQGNLAYLMPRAGSQSGGEQSGKVLPGPAFMQHPPQMPQLKEKYERLRELFPDWPGNDARIMAMSAAGAAGSGAGTGSGSPAQAQQSQQNANGIATSPN